MPKKRGEGKPERYVSKHQLSKWQRQKRLQNIIIGIGILTIVVVAAIVGWGLFNSEVRPYIRKAVRVNDVTFNMRYYINTLRIYWGTGQSGVSDSWLADYVEMQIQQQELIRQGALALGVQVDRGKVEAELKKSGVSVTREQVDAIAASDLVDKLRDEHFKSQIPASQPQFNALAMLLEDEETAQGVKARLEAGEEFAALAEELSVESVTQAKKGELGWMTGHVADLLLQSSKFGEIASGAEVGLLTGPAYDDSMSKNVGYWVVKVVEKAGDPENQDDPLRVHASGILLGSEGEARAVKERLVAGADFPSLAKELSQDTASKEEGGDLGWFYKDQSSGDFQEALFTLPLGEVSGPLRDGYQQTKGGYWLLKVVEREESRPLSDEHLSMLVGEALNNWVEGLYEDPKNKVESFLDEEMKAFALREVRGY
ncbi:MAG: peptidylprolyl isomerase [Chloroflexota bacterium]